jgi:hypothetical protein
MIHATRSKIQLVALWLIILGSVSAVLGWKRWHDRNTWTRVTAAQIESAIGQHIPIGTSRAQVASYLDEKKIRHSYYGSSSRGAEYYNSDVALIRNTASSELITTDIQVIFRFDSNMKLKSYEVHEVYTGP